MNCLRFKPLLSDLHEQLAPHSPKTRFNQSQTDGLSQRGRKSPAGNKADFLVAGKNFVTWPGNAVINHFEADKRPLDTPCLDFLQCFLANKVKFVKGR